MIWKLQIMIVVLALFPSSFQIDIWNIFYNERCREEKERPTSEKTDLF